MARTELALLTPGLLADPAAAPPQVRGWWRVGRRVTAEFDLDQRLLRALGWRAQEGAAVGPVSALADGLPGDDGAVWLRADAVSVYPDRDRAWLVEPQALALDGEEAERLAAAVRAHLAPEGMQLMTGASGRWYLRMEALPPVALASPAEAARGSLAAHLPRGADAGHWSRLMTECQMLLHGHAVNRAREAAGRLPANALWPWGAGRLVRRIGATEPVTLYADDPWVCALAGVAGVVPRPLASLPDRSPGGTVTVVDTGARDVLMAGRTGDWQAEAAAVATRCARAARWRRCRLLHWCEGAEVALGGWRRVRARLGARIRG